MTRGIRSAPTGVISTEQPGRLGLVHKLIVTNVPEDKKQDGKALPWFGQRVVFQEALKISTNRSSA